MSRIRTVLDALHTRREKALGVFLTNGFPEPQHTLPLLHAVDRGGADFIELGMPFSDPLAEGLPIQRSSARALSHGVTLSDALKTVRRFRETSTTPLLLMGYVNPIYRYGIEAFCRDAAAAGADGLILPDLPMEEASLFQEPTATSGLDLVHLIAPNTPDERIAAIDRKTTGFVYAVSITGLTGSGLDAFEAVTTYLERARRLVTRNRLLVGFGIRSHADAMRLTQHTDGYIVGSALITLVEQLWDDPELLVDERLTRVERFTHALKHGS